ncbi:sigma factor [Micromonospora sp. NPDC005806]|uniref:sigma factor n=1 Tax=Micromonospora sp. NPDC005806 TaxID=3364234 RepID=UPI00368CB7C7
MTTTAASTPTDLEAFRVELTGYAYRMLGSVFDAEGAVQESLLRAWRGRDGFDGPDRRQRRPGAGPVPARSGRRPPGRLDPAAGLLRRPDHPAHPLRRAPALPPLRPAATLRPLIPRPGADEFHPAASSTPGKP